MGMHTDIIPGYPEHNLPTVLLYRGGACKATMAGMMAFGGPKTNVDGKEVVLWLVHSLNPPLRQALPARFLCAYCQHIAKHP